MIIGIDISQIVYEGTGVARYVSQLVRELILLDQKNTYVLFGSALRQQNKLRSFFRKLPKHPDRVKLVLLPFPPSFLDLLWNRLHVIPIEWFIGAVDIFWSSDWTQPPLGRATGVTTIHDLTIYRDPESFSKEIVSVHKRKLQRSKKECSIFFCDSEATRKDATNILGISEKQLFTIYPGYQL